MGAQQWQCAGGCLRPPGDDAGHAVLTVAGAVEAESGQKVKQVCREVLIKLVDGGLKAGGQLRGVHVLSQVLEDTVGRRERPQPQLGTALYRLGSLSPFFS